MITCKIILAVSVFCAGLGILAQMDAAGIITVASALISAIFGGVVLIITARSKAKVEETKTKIEEAKVKIEETKVMVELERVKNESRHKVQEVRAEAQKQVSLVNANALANVQNLLAANTAETIKSTAASDQVKVRVEQLESKLPIKQSEIPTEVTVVNPPQDPVNVHHE